jgi:RNA polymerase sigma-70 factor, ECF subfamily
MIDNFETQDLFYSDAIRKGNTKVFEEIYRHYYPKLCYYAYSLVHDRDVSKDVVHDVFSKIWTKRNDLQHVISIKLFLYRAVKNKALNYLNSEKIKVPINDHLELIEFKSTENIERDCERNELSAMIEKSINELSPKCQEVFILVKFHGMKYSEVAEFLKISPNTVENHMVKAFNKLRKDLTPLIR